MNLLQSSLTSAITLLGVITIVGNLLFTMNESNPRMTEYSRVIRRKMKLEIITLLEFDKRLMLLSSYMLCPNQAFRHHHMTRYFYKFYDIYELHQEWMTEQITHTTMFRHKPPQGYIMYRIIFATLIASLMLLTIMNLLRNYTISKSEQAFKYKVHLSLALQNKKIQTSLKDPLFDSDATTYVIDNCSNTHIGMTRVPSLKSY